MNHSPAERRPGGKFGGWKPRDGRQVRSRCRRPWFWETLESRLLLSGVAVDPTAAVAAQLAFGGNAGGAKDGPTVRIGYDLTLLQQEYDLAKLAAAAQSSVVAQPSTVPSGFAPSNPELQVADGRVIIDVAAAGDVQTLQAELAGLGMEITGTTTYLVEGLAPIDSLGKIAALNDVQFAAPSYAPITHVGAVTTQGDVSMHSDAVRSLSGFDGTGVIVGVLSDSFNSKGTYSNDVTTGDLPAGVNVLQDSASGTDEGRAMLQLVHDVAPGAGLAFATANGGQVNFANNIKNLANNAGAKVIVDDVSYFAEPFFQDGVIAQAVDQVKSQGVAYFSAAANNARLSYQSAFRAGDSFDDGVFPSVSGAPHFFGGTAQNFASSGPVQNSQSVTLQNNAKVTISFQWAQPFFSVSGTGSASDLDIYLINSANQVVAGGTVGNTNGDPFEFLSFQNTTGSTKTYKLMILKYTGPDPSQVKYVDFLNGAGGVTVNTFDTQSSTIVGHANAAGAEAVGAAWFQQTPAFGVSPPVLESYSSAGSTPILYSTTGTLLATPDPRANKPGIVAPDGGFTTVSGFSSFFGTSAAAPHAAAVAALMLQYKPTATPAQIYLAMESTAIDMRTSGFDNDSGHGLLQANRAIARLTTTPPRIASVTQVATPRNTAVASLNIAFSEPVTGLSLSNLRLTRNGGSNLLPGSATLTTSDKITWTLGNLSGLTGAAGSYRLEVLDTHSVTNLVGVPVVGNLDFAVASDSSKVGVVRGNADGSFSSDPALDTVIGAPRAIATGDVNGDGTIDLVALIDGASKVDVYLGQGGGQFAAPVAYSVGSSPVTVRVGDLNGDGRDDIVTANLSNSITVLMNDGTGNFPAGLRTDYATADRAKDTVIGDFDQDGSNDVAVSVENTGVVVFYNGSFNGNLSNPANKVTYAASADRGLAAGDVDADGRPDIVAAGQGAHSLTVLFGGPNRTFTSVVKSLPGESPLAVAVGDLNADGRLDLVYVDNSNSRLVTYLNDNTGRAFTLGQSIGPLSQTPNDVEVGDFNRDGKLDVIVATDNNQQQSTAFVYTNSGSALQTPPNMVTTGTTGSSKGVVVGELDGLTQLSTFTVDLTGPTVTDVVDVTPDPRSTSVATVDVAFSEPIDPATFTFQDLALTRNGSAVTLTGAVTTGFVSGTTYRIGGLDTFTAGSGSYVLTVNASGINDVAGNAGTGSGSDSWVNQLNQAPTLAAVADQVMTADQDTLSVPLSATDPDGDPLTYSAQAVTVAYALDQQLGLSAEVPAYQGYLGLGEKWLASTSGTWYFIVPNGQLYRHLGGSSGALVDALDPSYYTDPSLLYNAQPGTPAATVGVAGSTLTVDPAAGVVGRFAVRVTVDDGHGGADARFFKVTVADRPPVLAAIADQTMATAPASLTVGLSATDPDGDPLTYSAQAVTVAYALDQQLGLSGEVAAYQGYLGLSEKWLASASGTWYFIVPSGQLYRHLGGTSGALVEALDPSFYADASLLYNAQPGAPPATVGVSGATLTVEPAAGFTGRFAVRVTVSDGRGGTDTRFFNVTVADQPPVLGAIANQTMSAGQDVLSVPLSATDPDGDPLTYSAQAVTVAYALDQQLGLSAEVAAYQGYLGLSEKWLASASGTWYFIVPSGQLYRHLGGSSGAPVDLLDPSFYADTSLLYNAQPGSPPVTVGVSGATLTVDPAAGFTGRFAVRVTVSDGRGGTDTRFFTVTVADQSPGTSGSVVPTSVKTADETPSLVGTTGQGETPAVVQPAAALFSGRSSMFGRFPGARAGRGVVSAALPDPWRLLRPGGA